MANLATSKKCQIKSALRDVLSDDFNLTRTTRQIDRTDAILGNFNLRDEDGSEYPLHEPTGEKTRKTYDFTSKSTTKYCVSRYKMQGNEQQYWRPHFGDLGRDLITRRFFYN